jgi:putative DNA methylase
LINIYPNLFGTLLVPKTEELIATPYRFEGDKEAAKEFFEYGLRDVFVKLKTYSNTDYPLTVYYAFKQSEAMGEEGKASTGWETMLEGLMQSGFTITGTLPLRTEMKTRQVAMGTNALASSIVLVCRPARPTLLAPPAVTSSTPCAASCPPPCAICKKATSPP